MRVIGLLLLLFWLPFSALAQEAKTFTGKPIVLDGDTLMFGKTRVRLFGIAAPEMKELDGWYARAVVDDILQGYTKMTCEQVDKDRYKRPVAICWFEKDGKTHDLAMAILAEGVASVHRLYSNNTTPRYGKGYARILDATEAIARLDGKGFWKRYPFVKPNLARSAITLPEPPESVTN